MNRIAFLLIIILCANSHFYVAAQDKKSLSHDDYDIWNDLKNQQISPSAKWITYEANPQDGDGVLWLYNSESTEFKTFNNQQAELKVH